MAKNKKFLSFRSEEYTIPFILDLQIYNLKENLSLDEQISAGFLSFALPSAPLQASFRLNLGRHIVRRKSDRITGFIAGVPFSIASRTDYLNKVIGIVKEYSSYGIFVQVCIEDQNRRKGLATSLLRQLIFEAKRQQFDSVVAVLDTENIVGKNFFRKNGFQTIHQPFADRLVFLKKI